MSFMGNSMFGVFSTPLFHVQDGMIGMDRDGLYAVPRPALIVAAVAGLSASQVTAGWSIDKDAGTTIYRDAAERFSIASTCRPC